MVVVVVVVVVVGEWLRDDLGDVGDAGEDTDEEWVSFLGSDVITPGADSDRIPGDVRWLEMKSLMWANAPIPTPLPTTSPLSKCRAVRFSARRMGGGLET